MKEFTLRRKNSKKEIIELMKQKELSNQLEGVGKLIEEERYTEAKDKLEVIIREAKRNNLNIILNIAQDYYKFCKNPIKGKFKRKEIQSELELPKISKKARFNHEKTPKIPEIKIQVDLSGKELEQHKIQDGLLYLYIKLGKKDAIIKLILESLRKSKNIVSLAEDQSLKVLIKYFKNPLNVKNSPLLGQFITLINKIKKIERAPQVILHVARREIPVNSFKFLKKQFNSTFQLFRYILKGYFSQNEQDLLQRIVTYMELVLDYWEYELWGVDEYLSESVFKGGVYPDTNVKQYVEDALNDAYCDIKIAPHALEGPYSGEFKFSINFDKIIADGMLYVKLFKDFMRGSFTEETNTLIMGEIRKYDARHHPIKSQQWYSKNL